MKVLFLDIDGVANSEASVLARTGAHWLQLDHERLTSAQILLASGPPLGNRFIDVLETVDPTAVQLINRLLENADAKLVLSSSHRSYFVETAADLGSLTHMQRLGAYLRLLGIDDDKLIGITSPFGVYRNRGAEVRAWLDEHPEVTTHVALDDSTDFYPDDRINLVHVDAQVGMRLSNYFQALKVLNTGVLG